MTLIFFCAKGICEDDVELGLFFFNSGSSASAAGSSNSYRCSSGNAPLFFKKLRQFCSFQNSQRGEVFNDLREISHFLVPFIRFELV